MRDNDAQPTNGKTPVFTLTARDPLQPEARIARDAGTFTLAAIGGRVFDDLNADSAVSDEEGVGFLRRAATRLHRS